MEFDFGVGTVCVVSSDKSIPHLDLKNIKAPREVKELIHKNVEASKDKRRMRATELLGGEERQPQVPYPVKQHLVRFHIQKARFTKQPIDFIANFNALNYR